MQLCTTTMPTRTYPTMAYPTRTYPMQCLLKTRSKQGRSSFIKWKTQWQNSSKIPGPTGQSRGRARNFLCPSLELFAGNVCVHLFFVWPALSYPAGRVWPLGLGLLNCAANLLFPSKLSSYANKVSILAHWFESPLNLVPLRLKYLHNPSKPFNSVGIQPMIPHGNFFYST